MDITGLQYQFGEGQYQYLQRAKINTQYHYTNISVCALACLQIMCYYYNRHENHLTYHCFALVYPNRVICPWQYHMLEPHVECH